jgi:hypothetical protein
MPTTPVQAAKTLTALSDAKFLNLDASLRSLVHPAGMGGMSVGGPVSDEGPAILIHENFVFIHVGGLVGGINEMTQRAGIAEAAGRVAGGL